VIRNRSSWKVDPEIKYGDIVKGLPEKNKGVDLIYSSHVLEHLSFVDMHKAIENVYQYLKPGGVFRCVLPDMERYCKRYIESESPEAIHELLRKSMLGMNKRSVGVCATLQYILGGSRHLWMWDYKALKVSLEGAGFTEIRRAYFGDSKHPEFCTVEDEDRWQDELGIEAIKPHQV
jgi:SAM-dependent methyltransferase